jgi:hypothetical protein
MSLRTAFSIPVAFALIASFALALAGPASAERLDGADHGGRLIVVEMTGAAERPGPGDPDGSGTAWFTLNYGQGEICFALEVADIIPATAAHIHVAPVTDPGPVVVPLAPPTEGTSSGCVPVAQDLIKAILLNPENYYVNVHNADFPAGAVRGQLG